MKNARRRVSRLDSAKRPTSARSAFSTSPSTTSTRLGQPAKTGLRGLVGGDPSGWALPGRRESDAASDRVAVLAGEGAGELGEPQTNSPLISEAADAAKVEIVNGVVIVQRDSFEVG